MKEKLSMPFAVLKEYVTGFGTSHIFERAYFKDAYLMNAVRYLNEMWIVYTGGIAAAITEAIQLHRKEDTGPSSLDCTAIFEK